MFFVLSKIGGFFTLPSNLIGVLCVTGAVLWLTRWHQAGGRIMVTGIVMLLIFGLSPIGTLMLLPLSERFPPWKSEGPAPAGIIILGGAVDSESSAARAAVELNSAGERMLAMVELARRYPEARIVFTGGSDALIPRQNPESSVARKMLDDFGIARERIVLEPASRNTDENAALTVKLIAPQAGDRWILVTSAFHMPRSIGAFRAAGFDLEAYPVDWRSRGWSDAAKPFSTISAGLSQSDIAVHEWIGLFSYWITGRIEDLFPAPDDEKL